MKTIHSVLLALTAVNFSFHTSAEVSGEFKNVSFSVTSRPDGRMSFSASGGEGTLKNEKQEIVAKGHLKDIENDLTIQATAGAKFLHKPRSEAFPATGFSNKPVTQFAAVELAEGNQWTLKDANFLFLLEIPDATQPRMDVATGRSLARASLITLPKGTYTLWGYSITVAKPTGTVKFAHGKIVEATDATFK